MQGSGKSAFVYDSGSGYLTVNGADCATCEDQYYNPVDSSTSMQGYKAYSNTTSLTYGSATLNGTMYTDNMCLNHQDPETCISDFGFFLIKN
jgi:hypothetical protein